MEIRPAVYSGLFFYRGSAATKISVPFFGGTDARYSNPTAYGKKSGLSFATEWQSQWVSKQKNLYGLGLGFERMTSKANIVEDPFLRANRIASPTGIVNLASTNLAINPFVGRRFSAGPVTLDALAGVEGAFNLFVHEDLKIVSPYKGTFQMKRQDHPTDLRTRMQVNALYKQIGVSAGYSFGTTNLYYTDSPSYKNRKAYSNFLRVGISYRLK